MLGAYGSTLYQTDNFNRLAAKSLVFDQVISQTTNLEDAYNLLWENSTHGNLIQNIGQTGISPVLLTDEPMVASLAVSESFDRIVPVDTKPTGKMASSVAETELANFFAQATQWLADMEPGSIGWLHSRGLSGAWDAPAELRARLADSEDPEPPDFFQTPAREFDPQVDDPDELLGYQQVCAAQVTLLDDFLGVILDLMETEIGQSTLFCLMSPRGFPLGEHGQVGDFSSAEKANSTYNESVHVPLMVCLPERPELKNMRAIRNGSLVQPKLVGEILTDWFSPTAGLFEQKCRELSNVVPNKKKEIAFTLNGPQQAIQTHAWKLIRTNSPSGDATLELFAKPDDRWEVNDVSGRCPQIVQDLSEILDQWIATGKIEDSGGIGLSDELSIRLD